MLSFDLDINEPLGGGGVRPEWSSALGTLGVSDGLQNVIGAASNVSLSGSFEDIATSVGTTALNAIIPGAGSIVQIGLDALGFGADDYETVVKPKIIPFVKKHLEDAANKYLNNTALPIFERYTKYDAYISSYISYFKGKLTEYKADNSIMRAKAQILLFEQHLSAFRDSKKNVCSIQIVNTSPASLRLVPIDGGSFSYRFGSSVAYGLYTKKVGVSTASVLASPLTSSVAGAFVSPTSLVSDSVNSSDANVDKPFNWLFVIIPTVVVGFVYLVKYLKNKK